MSMEPNLVHRRIRDLRRSRGWTQEELAEQAHLSRDIVSRIERGDRQPRLETLQLIAGALDLSLTELLATGTAPIGRRREELAPLRPLDHSTDRIEPWLAEALAAAVMLIVQAQMELRAQEERDASVPRGGPRESERGDRAHSLRRSRRAGRDESAAMVREALQLLRKLADLIPPPAPGGKREETKAASPSGPLARSRGAGLGRPRSA